MGIDPPQLDPDPLRQLQAWLDEAHAAGQTLPESFALATADATGAPSVRMVLLRGIGPDGLRFYGDLRSRKARDLAANPRAAAVFHFAGLSRQARASGLVEPVPRDEAEQYFASRPRGHRLSAWASHQGQPVRDRSQLEASVRALEERYPGDVPLPPTWGGFRLLADRVEFWVSREERLHDRAEYRREPNGSWTRRRLQP